MPSSRILTELWRKAAISFKNIEQSTEDDDRLPNREELRQHQEAIQDIIDVFVATQESNAKSFRSEAVSHASAGKNSVPMISPSETSSVHSFFPPDTARSANNRIISQISPILPLPSKRKAAEIVPKVESSNPRKKATQQSPAAAVAKRSKHNKTSKSSLMTPEDDAYIWQEYTAHVELVDRLKLGKSAWLGLATRIAEKLHSNPQIVGFRLKMLKKMHGEIGADSLNRAHATSARREADANSLEGGGIDGASGSDHLSDSGSGSDASSTSDGSNSGDASGTSADSADRIASRTRDGPKYPTTTAAAPICSLHTIPPLQPVSAAAPPRPKTTKKQSHWAATQRAPVIEKPLSPPPHIARKTTFTHEDDVVLWNAYIRNGCEIPGESQLQKLTKQLNRNSTSGVAYRINRLIAEDQKVGIKDTHPLFTSSHDEYILRKYNNNKTVPAKQRLADETLSGKIAEKLQMEPVRVYYRLQRLLQFNRSNDNNNSSNSDTNSSTSTDSTASSTNNNNHITENTQPPTFTQRTANRYSESEDMAIYSAYLSSTAESQRQRALKEVAATLGRSRDSIQARLKRLLEDQRAVTYARNKTSPSAKPFSPDNQAHPKRKRGRPKKNVDSDNHTSTSSLAANNNMATQKLSVVDQTGMNSFNPTSPHAGFIHHAPQHDIISSASDSNNSLDESDSDELIAPTNTRGATIARRRQLQHLSDSSTGTSSQYDSIHATRASLPTKINSYDLHKPTASMHTSVSPPVVPAVTHVKQISEAALAAGARLVGARERMVDANANANANANALPTSSTTNGSRGIIKSSTHTRVALDMNSMIHSRSANTQHNTTTAALPPTFSSAATDSSRLATFERSQYRAVGSNPLMKVFMSSLQRQGMDILYPQTVHDQVLALVLGCLQHLHVHTAEPPYSTVLHCLQHCLRCTAHTLPRLQHVTNAQLRSVIVLLQRAECVALHGGPHVNTPITMRLAGGMRTFLDMRRRHDGYLETQMNTNEASVLQDVLWPIDQKEQHRLQEEMGLVVNEIKRNL